MDNVFARKKIIACVDTNIIMFINIFDSNLFLIILSFQKCWSSNKNDKLNFNLKTSTFKIQQNNCVEI